LLGGTWLQTSYNRNFRGNFAGIGGTYDPDLDAFLYPKPVSDFVLDDDFNWVPPIPKPDGDLWDWSGKRWRELEEVFDEEGNVCGVQLKEEN